MAKVNLNKTKKNQEQINFLYTLMKTYNPKDYHQQKCKSTLFDKNLRSKITSMKFENCEARLTS